MSYPEAKELIQAEKLIDEGNIDEALQLVNDFRKKKDLSDHERISYYIYKSRIAFYFFDGNEVTKYAEKAYHESQKLETSLLLLDVYIQMAIVSNWHFKTKEASEFITKSEDLLKKLPQDLSTKLTKRKANILFSKSIKYQQKGEFEKAIECAEQALALRQELEIKAEIVFSLFYLGQIFWQVGDLNRALEYAESCKILLNNLNLIHIFHLFDMRFGLIYSLKGELDKSLCYYEKALAFAEKENNLEIISSIYNNTGMIYQEKGDYDRALENMEKSLSIREEHEYIGTKYGIFNVSDSLFHLALDMNDREQAQRYLNRIKQIADQEKNQSNLYNQLYSIDRAVYLKNSPRALNRGKAEETLKKLIEEGIPHYDLLKIALLNLCDMLLFELKTTHELEILDELHVFISQLFDTVKNSRSYSLLAETYLLQARLSLITLDMIKARKLLTKAQEITENYGLDRLAIKISNEHDELLKKLDKWNMLKDSKASLAERLDLARPSEQMERMVKKREINVPELIDEDPIVLLIISEGGRPLFSESFVEEWSFDDHLFGGFLSAINSFSGEMFSEGLNRANFGEYTIIMNSLPPFQVCYLFKGQSYLALQRVAKFIENIKEDSSIWKSFNEYNQACRLVQLEDIPSLEPLITKIFRDKSIPQIA